MTRRRWFFIDPFAAITITPGAYEVQTKMPPCEKQEAKEIAQVLRKELLPVEVEGRLTKQRL